MNKLEQQELEQLVSLQKRSQKIIIDLGEISFNKIILDEKQNQLNKILFELQDEEKTIKEFLLQKYGGNLNINLEDGSY